MKYFGTAARAFAAGRRISHASAAALLDLESCRLIILAPALEVADLFYFLNKFAATFLLAFRIRHRG